MPAPDLPLLIAAARRAGEVAMGFAGSSARTWDKADGAGPVTEADLAVNDLLHDTLRAARPSYGWLSEETEDSHARLDEEHVFIIDPIDGTRSFVEGTRTWAHAIAVAERGRITAAVVYLPMMDKLYAAATGGGATLNGKPIRASAVSALADACVLAARPAMEPQHWRDTTPDFKRAYRPSLAYRLGLVAEGRFDAMLTLRPSWEWDIAAGALIVSEAGGACTDRAGADLHFNNADPRLNGVVAGGAQVQAAMLASLAPT